MSRPLLPSRGIFIPTRMIFNSQLPPAVLVTWIRLRCLAWSGWVTPPLNISEFASRIGIHPARLYRHLSQLQDISALSFRTVRHGKLIVSFPEEPTNIPENYTETPNHAGSPFLSCKDQESPDPPSYFPRQILGYLSYQEDLDGFSDDVMDDQDFVDAEAKGARQCEIGKILVENQNCELDQVAKFRHQLFQINQHGSHANP